MKSRAVKYLLVGLSTMMVILISRQVWMGSELDQRFSGVQLGISTGEVQQRLGPPDFVEETNVWLYFDGRNPYAALKFVNGRLQTAHKFQ